MQFRNWGGLIENTHVNLKMQINKRPVPPGKETEKGEFGGRC